MVKGNDAWFEATGIRECVMARMGQSDISDPKGMVLTQYGKRVAELVASTKFVRIASRTEILARHTLQLLAD